jgi:RimJ/RimL family protein N-acetyltransferase
MDLYGPDPDSRNTHVITTARLMIEPPAPAHAPALYDLAGGPDRDAITAGLLWEGPESVADIELWVQRRQAQTFAEGGFGWVIVDREGEVSGMPSNPLGTVTIRQQFFPGRCTVGYWLGRAYWGQGLMTEALTAMIDFAFSQLRMVKVEAEVFARNTPSLAVVERLGMRHESSIRRAVFKNGEWLDERTYGLIPEEWPVSDR